MALRNVEIIANLLGTWGRTRPACEVLPRSLLIEAPHAGRVRPQAFSSMLRTRAACAPRPSHRSSARGPRAPPGVFITLRTGAGGGPCGDSPGPPNLAPTICRTPDDSARLRARRFAQCG